jgi:hypothetical protein
VQLARHVTLVRPGFLIENQRNIIGTVGNRHKI